MYTFTVSTFSVELPNPELLDGERLEERVVVHRMASGAKQTLIRRNTSRTHTWVFTLNETEAYELYDFYKQFASSQWTVAREGLTTLLGYIKLNPLDLTFQRRSADCDNNDAVIIEMEFETI
jgi:hypothetical protein